MSKKPSHLKLNLTGSDIEAILCALPLVGIIGSDSEAQDAVNAALCESVAEKLSRHEIGMNANEVRVISAALQIAVLILTDPGADLAGAIEEDFRRNLSIRFFTINRLNDRFLDALRPLLDT